MFINYLEKKKHRCKPLLIGIFFLFCFIISCKPFEYNETGISKKPVPRARQGVLDVTGIDFNDATVINLDGEWEFYWNRLYEPGDFQNSTPGSGTGPRNFIQVPGGWLTYKGEKDKPQRKGYATYRLTILISEKDVLGIRIPPLSTAYKCWLNNDLVDSHGKVATKESVAVPSTKISTIPYHNREGNTLTLTLQISNYDDIWGGPYNSFLLGIYTALQRHNEKALLFDSICFGIIMIFAVYHFFLYVFWKKNMTPLLFGFCCLCIAFRGLFVGYKIIELFDIFINSWVMKMRINFFLTYICMPLFLYYFYYRYPSETSRLINRGITLVSCLLSLIVLVTPYKIHVYTQFIFHVLVFIVIVYLTTVFILAAVRKREGAITTCIGFLFFSFTTIIDILHVHGVIYTMDVTSLGFSVLILSQALIIAFRFSRAFLNVEYYSEQLKTYSNKLEEKVRERTEQLEQANTEKTNFFINFTHEIKTPLTLIGNFLEKDREKRGTSREVIFAGENLAKLQRDVVNFLDIEKMNRQQVYYDHNQIINLTRMIEKKSFMFADLAQHKGLKLTCEIPEKECYLKIDPSAMDRIINNLVMNALNYTPPGGEVKLMLTREGRYTGFSVKDTGIGLSKEQIRHLFKPYHQLSHTKRNVQGIGIGLSIVKKILDHINTEISVTSEPGIGSEFHISFHPYTIAPGDRIIPDEEYSKPVWIYPKIDLEEKPFDEDREVILLVEDNMNMLFYLHNSLKEDYNVYCARDGEQALRRLVEIPVPDLIISDIMMDGMDGYSFYDAVCRDLEYAAIPFFFLTARTTEEEKMKGLQKGAVDFLYKPFSINVLKAKINSVLKQQRVSREFFITEMEKKISSLLRQKDYMAYKQKRINNSQFLKNKLRSLRLTPREIDVVLLLVKGLEYKEISAELTISLKTLKPYVRNIYRKLNIHNKVELMNILYASIIDLPT